MNIMQHPTEICQVGHLKLSLPTLLNGNEPSGQRAYVYHSCKAALEQHIHDLPYFQMLSALGTTVGFSPIVDAETHMWTSKYRSQWKEPARYNVISWYSDSGLCLNNAAVAGDMNVLFPPGDAVAPLAANARRLASIMYAYIKTTLDFNDLVTPAHRLRARCLFSSLYNCPRQLMMSRIGLQWLPPSRRLRDRLISEH